MPDMTQLLLERIERLERRLDELKRQDRAADKLVLRDGVTTPLSGVSLAQIYVDAADGDLKVIFADGTVKTIVTDT
jgi:hypothetical protein